MTQTSTATADPSRPRDLPPVRLASRLLRNIRTGHRADILAATVTLNVLALALPIVILQTYDRIIPNDARQTLLFLVIGIGFVLMLDAVLRIARAYVIGWTGAQYHHREACTAVGRILGARLVDYEREEPGVHLDRLEALDTLRDFYSGQAILILVDLPFAALFLGLIAYLAGPLVLVPLTILILFAAIAWIVGRYLRNALEARRAYDDRRYNFIIEVLAGIHTVKGLGLEELMSRRYELIQENCAATGDAVNRQSGIGQGVGTLFGHLTMVAVAGIGSIYVINGSLTVGGLAASTLLAGRTLQPLMRAMGIWTQFQNIRVARTAIQNVHALPQESTTPRPAMPEVVGEVELRQVSMRFDEASPWVFHDLNLKVAAGEMVGIVGGNGCGKSSLMWMAGGLLQPDHGQVLIDGEDIARFDPGSVRGRVAYVPQRAQLLQGTILENLTAFRVEENSASAMKLAEDFGLDVITARMPDGYQTHVGSGSDAIPGGIMQRIAIVRALVGNPRVILFDAANSFLDAAGDARVRETLAGLKGKSTILLVSQRPSLLALCDRIYELRDGTLHERPRLDSPTSNPLLSQHFPI